MNIRHAAFLGTLLLCLTSCDMPPPERAVKAEPVHVTDEPWITAGADLALHASFTTDRPIQPGVHISDGSRKYTVRTGAEGTRHTVRLPVLAPGTYRCDIVAGVPIEPYGFPLKVPAPDRDTVLAILAGGWESPETLLATIEGLARSTPDAVCLAGAQVAEREGVAAWQQDVITPLHRAAPGAVIARMPDFSRMSPEVAGFVFPGVVSGENYALSIGALHLAMLAPEYLMPARLASLKAWLASDMQQAGSRWRAVMLPESLIDARTGEMSEPLLDLFGPVFEQAGVALVLGAGDAFYHRSVPIGDGERGITYVNLCSLDRKRNAAIAKSDATAFVTEREGFLRLAVSAAHVEGAFLSADGETLDRFSLGGTEPVLTRAVLVGKRERQAAVRREVRALVRQCFRAVPNPKRPGSIGIMAFNPTDMPLEGFVRANDGPASFRLNPPEVRFALPARGVSRSAFALLPEAGQGFPEVTVSLGELEARTPFVLVPQKSFALPFTADTILYDGAFSEPLWGTGSSDPGPFGTLEGRAASQDVIMTRLVATAAGLAVAFRHPVSAAGHARQHDDPIWRDGSVEVFVDPENRARRFFHFGVTENGVRFDANDTDGIAWSPEWSCGLKREGEFIHIEMLLPYAAFGVERRPPPGTVWRINLTRNVRVGDRVDVFQLAPTYGPNDRSGLYAAFRFE